MWLLPALARVSSFATRVFYRLTITGDDVPRSGPVLLVANHPNSLLDPAMVATAAKRPVRFLAKSGLFTDPLVGWLVRGAGAIPVYRAQDDPSQLGRNTEMFRAVHTAIADGAAVGIFPEGISHSSPAMAPLKTGAARIALGAVALRGDAFPIVPIGLIVREKETFRSEALAIIGRPIAWDDVARSGVDDADAVREITARIERALHDVTVNLERWEDAPIVESAEAIHAAELGVQAGGLARLERVRDTAQILAALRSSGDPRWAPLAEDVRRHHRVLRRLGLQPADLREPPRVRAAVGWTLRKLPLAAAIASGVAALGIIIFWIPYRLTAVVSDLREPDEDTVSTNKVLGGGLLFVVWILLAALVIGITAGAGWGLLSLIGLPALASATLWITERWTDAWTDARRFFLLRRHDDLLSDLRETQRSIAWRLEELRASIPPGALEPRPRPPAAKPS